MCACNEQSEDSANITYLQPHPVALDDEVVHLRGEELAEVLEVSAGDEAHLGSGLRAVTEKGLDLHGKNFL